MKVDLDVVPKHQPELIWRVLDEEIIIIRPSDGQIRVLNDVGAFVWQHIDGDCSFIKILEFVCDEFNVENDTAETDLIEFLDQLADEGFLILR